MPYSGLQLHAFQTAEIRAGLSQSHTYARAVYELDELFGDWQSLSKPVQAAVLAELQYAITSSTRCSEQQDALSAALKTAKQVLPEKKWAAVQRSCRTHGVDLARRKGTGEAPLLWQCWILLPQTALVAILQQLDPATLARALCCCTEWRRLGTAHFLWAPHTERLFRHDRRSPELSAHQQFTLLASQVPVGSRRLWGSHRYARGTGNLSLLWSSDHALAHLKPTPVQVLDTLHILSGRQQYSSDDSSYDSDDSSDSRV